MEDTEQKIKEVKEEILEIVAERPKTREITDLNVKIVGACLVKLEILYDIKNLQSK